MKLPKKSLFLFLFTLFSSFTLPKLIAENPKNQADANSSLPLVFSEDFEKGRDRWEATDEKVGLTEKFQEIKFLELIEDKAITKQRCEALTTSL